MIFGQTLWIVIVAYACSFLGALQVPIFVATLSYSLVGVIYDFKSRSHSENSADESAPVIEQIVSFFQVQSFYGSPINKSLLTSTTEVILDHDDDAGPTESSTPKTKMHLNVTASASVDRAAATTPLGNVRKSQSEIYFKALFLACVATIVYNHVWILFITFVPIFTHLANKFVVTFGIKQYVLDILQNLTAGIQVSCHLSNPFYTNPIHLSLLAEMDYRTTIGRAAALFAGRFTIEQQNPSTNSTNDARFD